MECRLVRLDIVRPLKDVDLAGVGPGRLVDLPGCGPGTATLRHVADVEHGDVVRAILVVALDTDRVATRAGGGEGVEVICAHDERGISREREVGLERSGLVDVVPDGICQFTGNRTEAGTVLTLGREWGQRWPHG